MKIKELIIEEFGKFKNKRLSFDNPLTLIYGPNESGKTTILEAVEYSLIPNAILSREYPLKESKLILEHNNEIFELKKGKLIKGKSPFIDFITSMKPKFFRNIFHIRTGELEISKKIESGVDFASHLKEKILELENFYGFKNVFEEKLGNLVIPSKRKSNIEEEIRNLKEKKAELEKKKRDWGEIRKLMIRIEDRKREKKILESQLKEKVQKLENMERAKKIEEYKKELTHRQGLKRVYEDLELLDHFTEQDYLLLKKIESELVNLQKKLEILMEKEGNIEQTIKEIDERLKNLKEEEKNLFDQTKQNFKGKKLFIFSILILIILNIILKIFLSLPMGSLIPSLIMLFILAILISTLISKRKIVSAQHLRIEKLRKNRENEENKKEKENDNLIGIKKKIEELNNRLKEFKEKKEEIFRKTGVDSFREYEKKWERKSHLLIEKDHLKRNLEDKAISPKENISRIDTLYSEIDLLSKKRFEKYLEEEYLKLNDEVKKLNEKINNFNIEIARMETQINMFKKNLEIEETEVIKQIDEFEMEIEKKEKSKLLLIDFYKILKEIEEETEIFLKKVIEEEGSKWFSRLTQNEYKGIEISKWEEFYIILNNNEKKRITWLSKGAQDQLYFSLRLALAQKIIGKEAKFFLILDDPFITFDHQRAKEALEILREISKEYQIILATKDEYIKELFEKTGGNIIEIEKI